MYQNAIISLKQEHQRTAFDYFQIDDFIASPKFSELPDDVQKELRHMRLLMDAYGTSLTKVTQQLIQHEKEYLKMANLL